MARWSAKDQPIIDPGNPAWSTIEAWAKYELERLREKRETVGADQRELDLALGYIHALCQLLKLPDDIRRERKRDPLMSEGFDLPPPAGF